MRLKSLLLMPVLLTLFSLVGLSVFAMVTGGPTLAWGGVALAALPFPATVAYLVTTEKLARTSANLPVAFLVSGIGFALTLIGYTGPLQPAFAGGALLLLVWYVFSYSRFGNRASQALTVGKALPDFTLEDADGSAVSSATFRDKPALFLFYRGNWCPLCMAQIQEVADDYKRLAKLGVEVALVSPQPHAETAKLAKKFDVPFRFLVDPGLKAAQVLDIYAKGGTPAGVDIMGYGRDTVLPTVIATDETGTVIFLDETDNYRVRPEPETFLKIFEAKIQPAAVAAE